MEATVGRPRTAKHSEEQRKKWRDAARKKREAKVGYAGHRKKGSPPPKRKYTRKLVKEGPLTLSITTREADALKSLVTQLDAEAPKRQTAFGRAMALQVGEEDLMPAYTAHAFSMQLRAAEKGKLLDGREFVHKVALFSPGVGLPAMSVLWFKRVK